MNTCNNRLISKFVYSTLEAKQPIIIIPTHILTFDGHVNTYRTGAKPLQYCKVANQYGVWLPSLYQYVRSHYRESNDIYRYYLLETEDGDQAEIDLRQIIIDPVV
jgi:hypothetical protein